MTKAPTLGEHRRMAKYPHWTEQMNSHHLFLGYLDQYLLGNTFLALLDDANENDKYLETLFFHVR